MAGPVQQLSLEDVSTRVACCPPLGSDLLCEGEARSLADAFKALGDPVRLQILDALVRAAGKEICACDFVGLVGKSQPTVSHHLKVLREAGWVTGERRGTWVYYSLRPERFGEVAAVLTPARAQQAS